MSARVVTEFGANTKKFDAAVDKSAKNARKKLASIGDGARAVGGRFGELAEKIKNLGGGGKLALITAGIAAIGIAIVKVTQMANDMFAKAAEDAQKLHQDLESVNATNNKVYSDQEQAINTIWQLIQKKQLTNKEMWEANKAIYTLPETMRSGFWVDQKTRTLQGADANSLDVLMTEIRQKQIDAMQAELKSLQSIMAKNQAIYDQYMESWLNRKGLDPGLADAAASASLANVALGEKARALILEIKRLERDKHWGMSFFGEQAQDIKERQQREKERQMLEEQQRNIRLIGGAQSQVFSNSLTSRGGWQSGARLIDNTRYQQRVLQHNVRMQNSMRQIEQRLNELKRI